MCSLSFLFFLRKMKAIAGLESPRVRSALQVQMQLAGRDRQSLRGADGRSRPSSCCPACLKDSVLVDKLGVAQGHTHVSGKKREEDSKAGDIFTACSLGLSFSMLLKIDALGF